MKFSKGKIVLEKEPSELDDFVFDFVNILQKHTDYSIVSGYVAIIAGRIRGTDDVDIIVPKKTKEEFKRMIKDLVGSGYWCINTGDIEEMFDMLMTGHSIRIAENGKVSPNFEIKIAKSEYDLESLEKPIEVLMKGKSIKIAPLELQIAYKEVVLKSEKDIEDARHIRIVAEKHIDKKLVDDYKKRLRKWMSSRLKQ